MPTTTSKLRKWYIIRNDLPFYTIIVVWAALNIFGFIRIYLNFYQDLEYFYLKKLLQHGVSVAKAGAIVININCLLILLPVCRILISYLRSFKYCPIPVRRGLFDNNIVFHRYIGFTIIMFSAIHTAGHIYNIYAFVVAFTFSSSKDPEKDLIFHLSTLKEGVPINPLRDTKVNKTLASFGLVAAYTGIFLTVALICIWITSIKKMRHLNYNLFWYMHHVMVVIFMASLVFHGIQGIVTKQSNLKKHDPKKCYQDYKTWAPNNPVCDIPKFVNTPPTSYLWVIGPLVIYLIERVIRFLRGLKKHTITKFDLHPSDVLELQLDEGSSLKMKYRAGQYLYLNYPSVARIEWHPFTITSAPDDPYVSVHIRKAGDWTRGLIEVFKKLSKEPNSNENVDPRRFIHVDGPYGSCAEDIFDYSTLVLIGAGIGVTPYASILQHILNTHKSENAEKKINKVYFFWICPNFDSFEWFGALLQNLEDALKRAGQENLLECRIYLTKTQDFPVRDVKIISDNAADERDLFTGLRQKTYYGRPNFDEFFKGLANSMQSTQSTVKQKVGVFFCGPPTLSNQLHQFCNENSNQLVRFYYNKENF